MANLKKFTRSQLPNLLGHFARAKDEHGEYIKHSNQNINTELSGLNYDALHRDDNLTQFQFIKKRTTELGALKRADVNVMCSWVVTMPQAYYEACGGSETLKNAASPYTRDNVHNITEFFKQSLKFISDRYGAENMVSAYVHLDETTPHMHVAFVPVVYDKSKKKYKVSAKERITRADLQSFHKDFSKYLNKALAKELAVFDLDDVGVLTHDGVNRFTKTQTIDELKQKDLNYKKQIESYRSFLKTYKVGGKSLLKIYDEKNRNKNKVKNYDFER